MGLNIGAYNNNSIIDAQALNRAVKQILTPADSKAPALSQIDLSKFNRISLGLDLYAERTSTQTAVQAAKAASDFDLNLSSAFSANVQYLNSQAAQSLFTSKENTGKVIINIENAQKPEIAEALQASANIENTANLNKDRRGSNPFAFYASKNDNDDGDDFEFTAVNKFSGLNIFA